MYVFCKHPSNYSDLLIFLFSLGYTVIQIPEFIRALVRKLISFWRRRGCTNEEEDNNNFSAKGIQNELGYNFETHSSQQKQIGIEEYLNARLKIINEFEHNYVNRIVTDLKLLLRLEKSSILRLSRKL